MPDAMRELVALHRKWRELDANGAYANAVEVGEEMIQLCPAGGARAESGEVCREISAMKLQFWTDCEAAFQAGVEQCPRTELPWIERATALIDLERFEEAILSLKNALSMNPDSADALWRLGLAKSEAARDGLMDEALRCFDRALELNRDLEPAWYYKAMALSDAGRNEEALACIEALLRFTPGNYFALQLRGILLENLRRFPEARACYAYAQELSKVVASQFEG